MYIVYAIKYAKHVILHMMNQLIIITAWNAKMDILKWKEQKIAMIKMKI